MVLTKIRKRNGDIMDFDQTRIAVAIEKAAIATQQQISEDAAADLSFIPRLVRHIIEELEHRFSDASRIPDIESIQDVVERELLACGRFDVAKNFILYRAEHARLRAEKRISELEKIEKNLLKITKRNHKKEVFNARKLRKTFSLAAKGLEKICRFEDAYEIFKNRLVDGMPTCQLLDHLKKACIDLVTVENTNWQKVAARLYVMQLYKEASVNRKMSLSDIYSPAAFSAHFDRYVRKGLYYAKFYDYYSKADIEEAGRYLERERDFSYIYSTVLSFDKRYLLNPNKKIYELPQEMYMAVALFLAVPEKNESRLEMAKKIYDVTSTQKLSLPTPTLINARTNFHQLSSCFKLNIGDDLRAIYHGLENMAQISKYGGGVGVYLGHIRSKGSSIRGVSGASGGVIPWARLINNTACAVNQLGSRLGAISPTLDVWHRDIQDFLNLQTETGDIRGKAFDVFPAIAVPDIFMKRVEADADWTLFDPHEILSVTGERLEDRFGREFEEFYTDCERNASLVLRQSVRAKDLMKRFLKTAVETGMPYVFFRDTVNDLNPNKHAGNIYSTQLCTEICQNTSESVFSAETVDQGNVVLHYKPGDTVVCNLASINVAKVNADNDIAEVVGVALRVLDNIITLNYYPIQEAKITAQKYRSIGLGFMGLAEYLACHKLAYDSKAARTHVDTLFEKYALAVLTESNRLATERGAYSLFEGSDWQKGLIFGRNGKWFQKHSRVPQKWADLITRIQSGGLRFAYHLAPAPNTSTAAVVGTTAGLLPVYKKFFVETNAIAPIVTVAPGLDKDNFWYYKEYASMDMTAVIDMIATVYKWVDQSISFEWLIDPAKTSPKQLYDYYVKAWKMKIKTVYYLRSMSGNIEEACASCSG